MTQKYQMVLFAGFLALLMANISYAAFPVKKINSPASNRAEPSASDDPEEEPALPPGHGHGHGHGGHAHHGGHSHGPSGHWHGVAHHYHSHAYHYHTHYQHYHEHYGHNYSRNDGAYFGATSLLFDIFSPIGLLLFGGLTGIGLGILGVIFGCVGLAADRWKGLAAFGLILGIIEIAVLAALYAAMII
jgi:hypothetical protein